MKFKKLTTEEQVIINEALKELKRQGSCNEIYIDEIIDKIAYNDLYIKE